MPPDYAALNETAELFTKALLLGMETETARDNFADDGQVEILPFEEALAYMKKRVPVDRDTYYALADKTRFRAFTVGRLADGDAVARVQKMLSDSIEDGSGLNKFLQMSEGELADAAGMGRGSGWYYETVYRTNTSTAYNVGRAIAFEETPPVALELLGIDDARQTETCHALTVPPFRRPYNDPVWQSLWPPFHFNCRTTVRAIYDESEIDEAGGPEQFYSQGTPGYTPAKGFGAYPADKGDSWWDLTDAMRERAEGYGIMGELDDAREKLVEPEGLLHYSKAKLGAKDWPFEPNNDFEERMIVKNEMEKRGVHVELGECSKETIQYIPELHDKIANDFHGINKFVKGIAITNSLDADQGAAYSGTFKNIFIDKKVFQSENALRHYIEYEKNQFASKEISGQVAHEYGHAMFELIKQNTKMNDEEIFKIVDIVLKENGINTDEDIAREISWNAILSRYDLISECVADVYTSIKPKDICKSVVYVLKLLYRG